MKTIASQQATIETIDNRDVDVTPDLSSVDPSGYDARFTQLVNAAVCDTDKVRQMVNFHQKQTQPLIRCYQDYTQQLEKDKQRLAEDNEQLGTRLENQAFELAKLRIQVFGSTSEKQAPLSDTSGETIIVSKCQPADDKTEKQSSSTKPDGQQKSQQRPILLKNNGKQKRSTMKRGQRLSAQARFDRLERQTTLLDLTDAEKHCENCGNSLHEIRKQAHYQLDYTALMFQLCEYIAPQYGCRHCANVIKTAKIPTKPLDNIPATASTLSYLVQERYCFHMPYYRQAKKLSFMHMPLSDTCIAHWTIKSLQLLEPIVDELAAVLNQSHYVQADETTCQVLNEADREATSKSYLWAYRFLINPLLLSLPDIPEGKELEARRSVNPLSYPQGFLFTYSPTRSQSVVDNQLQDFQGYAQSDAYAGYNGLRQREDIVMFGCLAHCRRYYSDIINAGQKNKKANQGLAFIQQLYLIEDIARNKGMSAAERQALRQEKVPPILAKWQAWCEKSIQEVPPQSPIGRAIAYTLNHWDELTRYKDYGDVEIDNNLIENAIRPFAVGRKNWLFSKSPEGMKANAIAYSLMQTCLANKIDPFLYFKTALERVGQCVTRTDYRQLLPFNLADTLNQQLP